MIVKNVTQFCKPLDTLVSCKILQSSTPTTFGFRVEDFIMNLSVAMGRSYIRIEGHPQRKGPPIGYYLRTKHKEKRMIEFTITVQIFGQKVKF